MITLFLCLIKYCRTCALLLYIEIGILIARLSSERFLALHTKMSSYLTLKVQKKLFGLQFTLLLSCSHSKQIPQLDSCGMQHISHVCM